MNTIAIGDIHGRYNTFLKMLHVLERYGLENSNLVLLGDYVDRGPFSKEVIDKIRELQTTFPNKFVALKGNHEDMMWCHYRWQTLVDADSGRAWNAKRFGDAFLYNGGTHTLASFHVDKVKSFPDGICSKEHRPPEEYLDWIGSLPVKYEDEHAYYVHAGFRPNVDVADQDEDDCLWIRYEFMQHIYSWGKPVVHGHTPGPFYADHRRIGVDMGAGYSEHLCAVVLEEGCEPNPVWIPIEDEDKKERFFF